MTYDTMGPDKSSNSEVGETRMSAEEMGQAYSDLSKDFRYLESMLIQARRIQETVK